jgi:anti-anti-sigma regulatory factor
MTAPARCHQAPDEQDSSAASASGDLQVEFELGGPVLWMRGEIDAAVVERFEFHWAASPPPLTAVDAGEATFVDSAVVALLLQWVRAASVLGAVAVLRRSSPCLERVLHRVGLDDAFERPTQGLDPRAGQCPGTSAPGAGFRRGVTGPRLRAIPRATWR